VEALRGQRGFLDGNHDFDNFIGFSIDVVGPDSIPGCAIGATITFRVDGREAREMPVNQAGQGASLNLSLP
jgi:hypothetical protein